MATKFYKDKGWRTCSSCHTYKSWDLYTISKYSKLGYSSSCKACCAKVKAELRKTKCNKQKEVTSWLEQRSWSQVYPLPTKQDWEWEIIEVWTKPLEAFYEKLTK